METKQSNLPLIVGAAAAVVLGIVVALLFLGRDKGAPPSEPEKGSLSVDVKEAPTLDPARSLRCYVNGQFVGETTLSECARRNGVSTQALDVGLDESGALVAAETASLAPPPVTPITSDVLDKTDRPVQDEQPTTTPADSGEFEITPRRGTGSQCLRFVGGDWRQLSSDATLSTCVSLLFDGQCVRPGDAVYGRWGDQTLRLVPGRVEQSGDNRSFRTLERRAPC